MGTVTAHEVQTILKARPGPLLRRCPIVAADGSRCDNPSGWSVVKQTNDAYGIAPDAAACWCLAHALRVSDILTNPLRVRAA